MSWRRNTNSDQGFTLVELLVVIGIIAALTAMLVPALQKARTQAKDVECASTMRQCLLGVLMYNGAYKGGLANYMPNCPFWGDGFLSTEAKGVNHINYLAQDHLWKEGRSGNNYWRGYLVENKFANASVVGCSAVDYSGNEPFISSYNGTTAGCLNQFEPVADSQAFRKRPAFVWYGPGCTNEFDNVAIYNGGNLTGPPGDYKHRSPIITCPQPFISFVPGGNKIFHVPHRLKYGQTNFGGSMTAMPYAENVGYSDGSVKFYANKFGGTFKPD